MLVEALRAVHRLDEKIDQTLGKPYHVLLGASLVVEIIRSTRELFDKPFTTEGYVRSAFVVVVGLLLLVHQVGELSDRLDHRRLKR